MISAVNYEHTREQVRNTLQYAVNIVNLRFEDLESVFWSASRSPR